MNRAGRETKKGEKSKNKVESQGKDKMSGGAVLIGKIIFSFFVLFNGCFFLIFVSLVFLLCLFFLFLVFFLWIFVLWIFIRFVYFFGWFYGNLILY